MEGAKRGGPGKADLDAASIIDHSQDGPQLQGRRLALCADDQWVEWGSLPGLTLGWAYH